MGIGLDDIIVYVLDPTLLDPNIHASTIDYIYAPLFLLLLFFLFRAVFQNKSLMQHVENLWDKASVIAKLLLFVIMIHYLASSLSSMEVANNLVPCANEIGYKALLLKETGSIHTLLESSRPYGPAVISAGLSIIPGISIELSLSIIGIIAGLATILAIFIATRHFTGSDPASILSAILFVAMPTMAQYYHSGFNSTSIFGLVLVILLILISTDRRFDNRNSILLVSSLLLFIRIEGYLVMGFIIGYLVWRWLGGQGKTGISLPGAALAYLSMVVNAFLLLPLTFNLEGGKGIALSFGFEGLFERIGVAIAGYDYAIGSLPLVIALIGMIVYIKPHWFKRIAHFPRRTVVPLCILLTLFIGLALYQQYSGFTYQYHLSIYPSIIVLVGYGLWAVGKLLRTRHAVWIGVVLIVLSMHDGWLSEPYRDIPLPLHTEGLVYQHHTGGNNTLLYGPKMDVYSLKRFYPDTEIYIEGMDVKGYDYVVTLNSDYVDYIDRSYLIERQQDVESHSTMVLSYVNFTPNYVLFRIVGTQEN